MAAYKRKAVFHGETPMAKASPGQPRTQRAQKSKAQDASPEPHREEGAEQPAFIKSLESLNIGELRRVITFAEARIREREAGEKAATREELQKLAQERGFSMTDLFGSLAPHGAAKRGRKSGETGRSERAPVEAKYRGPNGEMWSGRGRMPKWLHAAEAEGKSRDSFLIQSE
jgi:DNA-binding protein H-NS